METHLRADRESRFTINTAQRTSHNGGIMASPAVEIEIDIMGPNGTGRYRYNGEETQEFRIRKSDLRENRMIQEIERTSGIDGAGDQDNKTKISAKTPIKTSEHQVKTSVQDDEESEEFSEARETTLRIRGNSQKSSKTTSEEKGKESEHGEPGLGRTCCCLPCVAYPNRRGDDSPQDKKNKRSKNNERGTSSKVCSCIPCFKEARGVDDSGPARSQKNPAALGVLSVWLLALVLTAGLAIAALAVDEWSSLEHAPTQYGRIFGLTESFDSLLPSCKISDVVDATMESEYDKFNLDVSLGLLIVGIIADFVSVILGYTFCRARWMGKEKHWMGAIPTMVTDLMAADLILAACAIYNSDLEGVSQDARAVENTSCSTFVLNVSLSRDYEQSFYLALASACICVVKAVIFGVVAFKMHPKSEKERKKRRVKANPKLQLKS